MFIGHLPAIGRSRMFTSTQSHTVIVRQPNADFGLTRNCRFKFLFSPIICLRDITITLHGADVMLPPLGKLRYSRWTFELNERSLVVAAVLDAVLNISVCPRVATLHPLHGACWSYPVDKYWIFILKFSTLILTEKLQSHFFTVTETLNSDKSDWNQCYSESESAAAHCSHSIVVST